MEDAVIGKVINTARGECYNIASQEIVNLTNIGDNKSLIFDIETMGFSSVPIILIGLARINNDKLMIEQYLSRNTKEEPAILEAFASHLREVDTVITFNGTRFDIPFVEDRFSHHKMKGSLSHFLLEAKKAGYSVPDATLKPAVNAVGQIGRSKLTTDYYYYQGQKTVIRRIADKSAVYALYVVALAGAPDKAIMNFYRNERSLLTSDTQFLLAGAFALSGDKRTFTELLPPEFKPEEAVRTTGYCFDSPIRANALILNILLDTDLDNVNIPRYMDYLSKTYHHYYWYSTQDEAFTLLAFGKAARMASSTKIDGTIKVGGKEFAYKGGTQKFDLEPYGKKVSLTMKGNGRVYYSMVTEGIRSDGRQRIEDKGLQVRREFLDRNGAPVNLNTVKQNDLIIVKLSLQSSVNQLENVAITDLLPAGFEIENPRITETTDYAFIKNASSPQYMDIRDDRMIIYTSFRGGNRTQYFYYMVRAVTPGVFQYAPVVAEAMYDAQYYSANGQTRVKIAR